MSSAPSEKLLILSPILPQASDLAGFATQLAFLKPRYELELIDSMAFPQAETNQLYYHNWADWLLEQAPQYAGFIGFSFGGIILQQCLAALKPLKKPIVLLSAPSFVDDSLRQKLEQTLTLVQQDQIETGLKELYKHVYSPNENPHPDITLTDRETSSRRMCVGLERALSTCARTLLEENKTEHLHLVGAQSALVNKHNVIAASHAKLLEVPHASMRILEDNLPFCRQRIEAYLRHG